MNKTMDKLISKKTWIIQFALVVTMGLPVGLSANKAWGDPDNKRYEQQKTEGHISQSRAAAAAKARYDGKVLKVQKKGGTYKVKLLRPSGHVKVVMIDAKTGAIIN